MISLPRLAAISLVSWQSCQALFISHQLGWQVSRGSDSLISVMHAAACRYCSPADHLAKLGVHKVKKVSSTSVAALDGVPTTSAVTGLPPSAEECLHTAMTPASLAPHISSASQGLGVCWQGKQSDVTVPAEQQQQASGGLVTGLESAGDAVHQPGTGRTLKREAMDGTAELMAGAPARLQRHLPPVTQHAQPDAHLTKRHKCIMPGHFTAVPEGAKGEDCLQSMFVRMQFASA